MKGLGILALKQLDIVTTLTEALQNKKNQSYREGRVYVDNLTGVIMEYRCIAK